LDGKFIKNLAFWIFDNATFGGRLISLQSCLLGIPSYYMSMFPLNNTFVEKLTKHMRAFFLQCKKKKRMYDLVKWKRICTSNNKGGLNVMYLIKQNIFLLIKWWWKLQNQYGLWQKKVKPKYMHKKMCGKM
jgi:hypothetical protein